jgi:hypothetical protein
MSDTNIFDPDYVKKQQLASLQRMAAEQNSLRVQLYTQASADWIAANVINRDKGLPIAALPTVPKKITVSDAGEWTEAPFADLVAPVLPPVQKLPGDGHSIAASNPPADRTDQVLACLRVLNAKLDALMAKAGVVVALLLLALALPIGAAPCPKGTRGTVAQKTIGPSVGDKIPFGIAVRSIRCAPDGIALPDDASILPSNVYKPHRRIWPWQWFRKGPRR